MRAFALLDDPSVRVVSFDVFDTLLFRRVPDPVDAFALVGERLRERGLLGGPVAAPVFARLRVAAERRVRELRAAADGGQEILLADVYRELAVASAFAYRADPEVCADIEVDVENELLVPDLDVAALLDAARAARKTCVAVSDTYFTEGQLERLLGARLPPLDRLFVSSAHAVGKGGGLWPLVFDALGVAPDEVLHVGDNEEADGRVPRELGVRTVPFERREPHLGELLVRERRAGSPAVLGRAGDFGLTALRGKLLHRAEAIALPPELRPFWRYGAVTLGPALAGFADWVQERAVAYGASKALCAMREGAVLADLVNLAETPRGERVVAERLWLSRQVLARAAILTGNPGELAELLVRRSVPTVRQLAATLGLGTERLPALAAHLDARLDDLTLRQEVLGTLGTDPELRTHVVAGAAEARSRVVRLVERLRPPGERNLIIVDLGWQATMQALLDRVLRAEGVDVHTVGLYLLTHAGVLDRRLGGTEAHGFIGDAGEPATTVSTIIRSPEILEQACMPDHGSQVDLDAELEPVLASQACEAAIQPAERHALQQGIHAFQREWTRYRVSVPDALPSLSGAAPILRGQVARAVAAPTGEEARMFASWLHDENFGSAGSEAMVAGDVLRGLRYMEPHTLIELPMNDLYWPFGLAALHDEHLARAAELVALDAISWEAFGSRLETGDVLVFADDGWGFLEATKVRVPGRRNRFGLSLVRARFAGEELRALRLDPAAAPCLVRLDRVVLRCRVRGGGDPVEVRLERPEELEGLELRGGLRWVAPKVLVGDGDDPQVHFDLRALVPGRVVYDVELLGAMAVLPGPPGPRDPRLARAERQLALRKAVRRAELRTGLPITPALRRAQALARRLR